MAEETGTGPGAPSLTDPGLWERIRTAELPGESHAVTLSQQPDVFDFGARLQKHCNYTAESARRLEAEYRRFLYLLALDPERTVPSDTVDKALFLHRFRSGDAWRRFRNEVLGRDAVLHEAGPAPETEALYEETLDRYRREFGEEPPRDIWPVEISASLARYTDLMSRVGSALILSGILSLALLYRIWAPPSWFDTLCALAVFSGAALILGGLFLARGGPRLREMPRDDGQ